MSVLAPTLAGSTQAPDYIEAVEAWRVWRIKAHEGDLVLESLFVDVVWLPGVPATASCKTGSRSRWRPWRVRLNEHEAPQSECTCGIYGVRTAEAAGKYLDPYSFGVDRVIGRVSLWGDVVECTNGWRASSAYPLALWVPGSATGGRTLHRRNYLDEIAIGLEAYGVPVDVVGDPLALPRAVR